MQSRKDAVLRGKLDWPVEGALLYTFGKAQTATNTTIRWNGVGIKALQQDEGDAKLDIDQKAAEPAHMRHRQRVDYDVVVR
jgi:hypothetical protein